MLILMLIYVSELCPCAVSHDILEEMLTECAHPTTLDARRTTVYDENQAIAMGHPKDWGGIMSLFDVVYVSVLLIHWLSKMMKFSDDVRYDDFVQNLYCLELLKKYLYRNPYTVQESCLLNFWK